MSGGALDFDVQWPGYQSLSKQEDAAGVLLCFIQELVAK
jgi:hypothetical protein